MKRYKGYINLDGIVPFFFVGVLATMLFVVSIPIFIYSEYQVHKEENILIKECEKDLPREQVCVIIKQAVPAESVKNNGN